MDDPGSPQTHGWKARVRRWLWLDRSAVRTDQSEANRGFYSGGPPVYVRRKPVGRRFVVPVVALGVVIALIILAVRGAEAQSDDIGQRVELERPGFAVTLPAEWEVTIHDPWQESCGDTVWASAQHVRGRCPWYALRFDCRAEEPPDDGWLSLAGTITDAE